MRPYINAIVTALYLLVNIDVCFMPIALLVVFLYEIHRNSEGLEIVK